ncbi:putative iron-regulated protein [Beggiatoa alba B18LD]|uniref:Putative iron-regulated protein n=1 Tax=Beggiatoa alba B18LD TaxID=395493 RepID=I3CJ14_9GAMM|nr:imelysin family protein [Beggiatoa alba]EIJ43607.1 putative iron-regulated protein [Beggiatoa alba B18LD]
MSKNKYIIGLCLGVALVAPNGFAAKVTPKAVVEHYTDMIHAVYDDALTTAKTLDEKIALFLKEPSEKTLADARLAWKAARVPYQQSETFRFGNKVIDDWEGSLNAWPLDEGLIDYVDTSHYQFEQGNAGATANIIASKTLTIGTETIDTSKLTPELLAGLNEIGGSEANVATGYHAIEFLLWGQDLNGTGKGAGERPFSDYIQTDDGCTNGKVKAGSKLTCERRAEYLRTLSTLLISQLSEMTTLWAKEGAARKELLATDPTTGLRTILFGMGSLSLGELAGERMKVALIANSTEDEHDCFSDNTHNSHFYNGLGIQNVYLGKYKTVAGKTLTGASLAELVAAKNAKLDKDMQAKFADSMAKLQAIVDSAEKKGVAFDQLIAADNAEGNTMIKQAIDSLVAQTHALEKVAEALGVKELNPDTADHTF